MLIIFSVGSRLVTEVIFMTGTHTSNAIMNQFVAINTLNVIKRKNNRSYHFAFRITSIALLHPSALSAICLSRLVNRILSMKYEEYIR